MEAIDNVIEILDKCGLKHYATCIENIKAARGIEECSINLLELKKYIKIGEVGNVEYKIAKDGKLVYELRYEVLGDEPILYSPPKKGSINLEDGVYYMLTDKGIYRIESNRVEKIVSYNVNWEYGSIIGIIKKNGDELKLYKFKLEYPIGVFVPASD